MKTNNTRFYLPSEEEIMSLLRLASTLSKASAFSNLTAESIFARMLTARELDLPLMASLSGLIWELEGKTDRNTGQKGPSKIVLSAQAMNMMIIRDGHLLKTLSIDDKGCEIWAKRGDNHQEFVVKFTYMQAQVAGLLSKDYTPWKTSLQDMLWKSALTKMARRHFPDVIAGCMSEVDHIIDVDFEEVTEEPEKKKVISKKKQTAEIEYKEDQSQDFESFLRSINFYSPSSKGKMMIDELASVKCISLEQACQDAFENKKEFLETLKQY